MKKILGLILVLAICFGLCGCDFESDRAKQIEHERNAHEVSEDVYEFIDQGTGVHYLIFSHDEHYRGMGGITPRLNADGTVMVTEIE